MEFAFTEEQQMIRDTAAAFLSEVSSSEAIRSAMATETGFDPDVWQRICSEMFLQATHIPEAYGGMGLGYVELAAIMEQMGRNLLCSPFFSTVCLGVNALIVAGTEDQKQDYLTRIAEGSLTATLAYTGASGRWDAATVDTVCARDGDSYSLNGSLRYVIDGHTADLLIVAARSEGTVGEAGISLFAIPADTAGITRTWLPTMDQTRKQAQIELCDVVVPASALMGAEGQAWPQLAKVVDLATVALAAEQMGGTQQVLDMTVEYTKERVQFNRPIASFQSVSTRQRI